MYVICMYDIALSSAEKERAADARALRNVFKTCKRYLSHIQNSVFEGELTPPQLIALKMDLSASLRSDRDSCILFTARNNVWMKKELLTDAAETPERFL